MKRLQKYGLLCGLLLLAWFLPHSEAHFAGSIHPDAAVFVQQETVNGTDGHAQQAERLKTLSALPTLPHILETGNAQRIPFSFPHCRGSLAEHFPTNRCRLYKPTQHTCLQGRSTDFYIFALRKIRI